MSTYKYNHTLKLSSNIVGINGNELFSEINKSLGHHHQEGNK